MLFQNLVCLVSVYPSEIKKNCSTNNKTEAHKGLVTYSGREVPVGAMKSIFPDFQHSILTRTPLPLSASNKKAEDGFVLAEKVLLSTESRYHFSLCLADQTMYYTCAVSSFPSDRFHRRAQNKYVKHRRLQSNVVLFLVGIFCNNHMYWQNPLYTLKASNEKSLAV